MENISNNSSGSSELLLFMHIHGIQTLMELIQLSEDELVGMSGFSVHLLLEIDAFKRSHLNSDSDSND